MAHKHMHKPPKSPGEHREKNKHHPEGMKGETCKEVPAKKTTYKKHGEK